MNFPRNRFRPFLALALAALTLIGTADAAEGLEAKRVSQNKAGIAKVYGPMQPKVRAVLTDMEHAGYKPIIDTGVYRTPAEQAAKVRAGVSTVSWSFHNATNANGTPGSLAADIVDQRFGWSGRAPRAYWLRLANSARSHALYSGAHFGLSPASKRNFDAALIARNWQYSGPLGWDPSHVEATGVTLGQARRGLRPYRHQNR